MRASSGASATRIGFERVVDALQQPGVADAPQPHCRPARTGGGRLPRGSKAEGVSAALKASCPRPSCLASCASRCVSYSASGDARRPAPPPRDRRRKGPDRRAANPRDNRRRCSPERIAAASMARMKRSDNSRLAAGAPGLDDHLARDVAPVEDDQAGHGASSRLRAAVSRKQLEAAKAGEAPLVSQARAAAPPLPPCVRFRVVGLREIDEVAIVAEEIVAQLRKAVEPKALDRPAYRNAGRGNR